MPYNNKISYPDFIKWLLAKRGLEGLNVCNFIVVSVDKELSMEFLESASKDLLLEKFEV